MKSLLLLATFIVTSAVTCSATIDLPDYLLDDNSTRYQLRLTNGDILTGTIMGFADDSTDGEGIRFRTVIGNATIYASQIAEIVPLEESYRQNHRLFLMPSADPIGKNHFAGLFELLFLYAGAGYGPVSVTAGRSLVPGLTGSEQLSLLNAKFTFSQIPNETMPGGFSVAAGINLAWANSANQIIHPYLVSTFTLTRTRVTAAFFGKFGGAGDAFLITAARYGEIPVQYSNGSVGLALGIDTRFSERHGLHFVGEFWNADLTSPRKSAAMLGLRVSNTAVSADFGMAFFTAPAIAPYFGFSWTPF
ncbi:hypothetical protein MASR2M18_01610 [Ignavibacteria bacterium]|nr:hypothetical protein [Bacteroidota bacterium]MCZ2132768.1 hypothetical protein [Bacteroidota bacterium]